MGFCRSKGCRSAVGKLVSSDPVLFRNYRALRKPRHGAVAAIDVTGTPEHTDLEIAGEARAGGGGLQGSGRAEQVAAGPHASPVARALGGLEESQGVLGAKEATASEKIHRPL